MEIYRHFLLSQCFLLILSFVYGGELPREIKMKYAYCFEIIEFNTNAGLPVPLHSIDNICLDSTSGHYYLLSSREGGNTSFIKIPVEKITFVFMDFTVMAAKMEWTSEKDLWIVCKFSTTDEVIHLYEEVYRHKNIEAEEYKIALVQKLLINAETGELKMPAARLAGPALLYHEDFKDLKIFTIKEEIDGVVGKPVLIFMAKKFNISDMQTNNNIVLRFWKNNELYIVFTLPGWSEANRFYGTLENHRDTDIDVSIPQAVIDQF